MHDVKLTTDAVELFRYHITSCVVVIFVPHQQEHFEEVRQLN